MPLENKDLGYFLMCCGWHLQTAAELKADFLTNIVLPFQLPRANYKQANLSAIQAKLSDIQVNQSAL